MKEHATDVDFEHFEAELERSLTRVKIADKWRKKNINKLFHFVLYSHYLCTK